MIKIIDERKQQNVLDVPAGATNQGGLTRAHNESLEAMATRIGALFNNSAYWRSDLGGVTWAEWLLSIMTSTSNVKTRRRNITAYTQNGGTSND